MISELTSTVNENSPIRVDFLNENTPVVSSLDIARHFQKKHKHILRDIQDLRSNLPKTFVESNFGPMLFTFKAGNGATRKLPAFQLTRDAFALLVMRKKSIRPKPCLTRRAFVIAPPMLQAKPQYARRRKA